MVVDEIRVQAGEMVHVIKTVGKISRDLHPREPRRQISEAGIQTISKTISEIHTANILIHKINIITGDRCSEKFDQATMMAPANHSKPISELRQVHGTAKLALENQNILVANGASPRRRRRRRGEFV